MFEDDVSHLTPTSDQISPIQTGCQGIKTWCSLILVGIWLAVGAGSHDIAWAGDHQQGVATHGAGPLPANTGIDVHGQMHIHPSDRCPLCAMRPARYPEFSCGIRLEDNRTYYFCSPRCLLSVWADPQRYLKMTAEDIARITVRHYFTGEQIDGNTALWISGSDVIGPMGPALIPLNTEAEGVAFKRRHGATRIFRLMAR